MSESQSKLHVLYFLYLQSKELNLQKFVHGFWDFPGGLVAKTLCSQCRGPGFDPWLGS